ncbi:UNVERIFIED_ORG: hypothetical protein GGD47_003460 [Rhizobium etli]
MTADDITVLKEILARLEGKLDQVLDLREGSENAMDAEPAGPELEAADDFAAHDLVDTATAAERFGIPRDRLARWCRETEGRPGAIGVKQGGRWQVSISRIRALKL